MADPRLALLTLVWWAGVEAAAPPQLFPLDACPAGEIADRTTDGLHCNALPDEFVADGVYHMRQSDGSVTKVYCDMTGGRWNEIMRRGADAEKTIIAADQQLSFAGESANPGAAARYQAFYGDFASEFFVGTDQLHQLAVNGQFAVSGGGDYHSELLVELETVDSKYYFAIFRINSFNPLELGSYLLGTAGTGRFHLVQSSFNTDCAEAWFASDCGQLNQVNLPHLTRTLDGTARASGDHDWPHVEQPLQRISMKVRVNDGRFCTSQREFKFYPWHLDKFDVTMTPLSTTPDSAELPTNSTITCKDATKVITTNSQYATQDYTEQTSSHVFKCQSSNHVFDDAPLTISAICMTPCKADYTLVGPTSWAAGTTRSWVDRLACLSPLQEPAGLGPYQAAKRCSDAGEQLLDFPVPSDRLFLNTDNVGLITAMHYSLNPADSELTIRDLRGNYFTSHKFDASVGGDYKAGDRCVELFVDASITPQGMAVKQTACYNEELRFVCMSQVGCAPEQFLVGGFCYDKLVANVKDLVNTCYPDPTQDTGRNGMPAVPSSELLDMLASMEPFATPVAVGAFRRNDSFYQMDEVIPASDISGAEVDNADCAVLDTATKQLTAIECNDDEERTVICQYPGLPKDECPTIMKKKYTTATNEGSLDINSKDQISRITAWTGFNFYERQGLHELEYKCEGLVSDWHLQTKLDSLTNADVSHWDAPMVMACTTEDQSGYPANSDFRVEGIYLVHRCHDHLQTSGVETEQQQTCDHVSYEFTGAVLDCDACLLDPLAIDPTMPISSNWDLASRTLNHSVDYTCDAGLTTRNGSRVQQQTCTLDGWVGDVEPCDTCVWLNSFNTSSLNTTLTGGLQFGGLVEMECLPGLEAADGAVLSSAVCTPDAWNQCHDNFACDHCNGPPVNSSHVAFVASDDWDGQSRHQGTLVTYTCAGITVTETGLQLQQQNCTDQGWTGAVRPCGVCPGEPVNATGAMTQFWNGSRTFGEESWYRCTDGTQTASGDTWQLQSCGVAGWTGTVLPCDFCVGEPVNVTGMAAISSDFVGDNAVGAQVTYTCLGPLATTDGQLSQTVNCTQNGWYGDVLACEVCPPPPNGTHDTIRAVDASRNDGDRLGSSVTYRCNDHLQTLDAEREIVAVCENGGWSFCEPEIQCNYCSHLGSVSRYGGTLTWDYADVRELGTVVTLECAAGLATPDLNTTQTLTCGLDGWNQAVPCSICTDPVPTPPPSMLPNVTWALGDATATYTCLDTKKLPWGLTEFEMSCSPTGWSCAPACDFCAATPPPPAGLFPLDLFDNPGGQATYECNPRLQTALNQTSQVLTCRDDGWEGELLPCDECYGDVEAPSPGQTRTWSGNKTLDTTVIYECMWGKETQENTTYQTRNCTENGWTPPPIPCDLCVVPRRAFAYMTREWDGNRTLNSTVTYTCHGNLTTMANETEQTLTCTDEGWSDKVRSCALCRSPLPEVGNYTVRNLTKWTNDRLPGATLEYLCYTGMVQTVTCNGGFWEPEELPPCCEWSLGRHSAPGSNLTMANAARR